METSSHQATLSSNNSNVLDELVLVYPENFFSLDNGNVPVNEEEASKFWSFRVARPLDGKETAPIPDGSKMLLEMNNIRNSLLLATDKAVLSMIKDEAKLHGLKMIHDNQSVITDRDLFSVLSEMKQTPENERLVYTVYHNWGKKEWIAKVVDDWLNNNKMRLEKRYEINRLCNRQRKRSKHYRGGFSACCRNRKGNKIKSMMRHMLVKSKWCISLHCKDSKNTKKEKKSIIMDGTTHTYYLCTQINNVNNVNEQINTVDSTSDISQVCVIILFS